MGKLLDKVLMILQSGKGGLTMTGEKKEPIIINPTIDNRRTESYDPLGEDRLSQTPELPKKRPEKNTSLQARTKTALSGHSPKNVLDSEKRSKEGTTPGVDPVKTTTRNTNEATDASIKRGMGTVDLVNAYAKDTPGQSPIKSTTKEPGEERRKKQLRTPDRPVVPFTRPKENEAMHLLGADKMVADRPDLTPAGDQMPRRRQARLVRAVESIMYGEEMNEPAQAEGMGGISANNSETLGGQRKPKKPCGCDKCKAVKEGFTDLDGSAGSENQYGSEYQDKFPDTTPCMHTPAGVSCPKHGKKKCPKDGLVKEDSGSDKPNKGRLFSNLETARKWAKYYGGVVGLDPATGKYFVSGKGMYSQESFMGGGVPFAGNAGPGGKLSVGDEAGMNNDPVKPRKPMNRIKGYVKK